MTRTAIAMLLTFALLGGTSVAAELVARPEGATLSDAETIYPQLSIKTDWHPSYVVDDHRYRVDGNRVTEIAGPDSSQRRSAHVPGDYRLHWVGAADGVAFLVADRETAMPGLKGQGDDRRFYRLDLASMKWLEPFKLPRPSFERDQKSRSLLGGSSAQDLRRHVLPKNLLVTPKGILLLSEETAEYPAPALPDGTYLVPVGCHVSCYAPRDLEAKWSRSLRYDDRARRQAGYAMRSYDDFIERLTYVPDRFDDLVLVCPGEHDAIVCLSAADGKVRWRIPAIWEYERGFLGPSVFEHYINRFGLDDMTLQSAETPVISGDEEKIDPEELRERIRRQMEGRRKLKAARDAFYARYQGRITAGPIVVMPSNNGGPPKAYVAAARSLKPDPGCAEQPEHAILYEIELHDDRAEFTGMTRLPRPVIGRPYRSVPGGVVLACDRGCLLRLRTGERDLFRGFFGPGKLADDLLLQIEWYREYLMPSPSAWFVADLPTDVAAFSKTRLFRPGTAYVRAKGDQVYHLQINVVDLRTGLDRNLTLSVPFQGELPIPETGLSSFNPGTAAEQLYAHGPYLVWIDRLSVDGDRLAIVVAHGEERTELTFDLSAMLGRERRAEFPPSEPGFSEHFPPTP